MRVPSEPTREVSRSSTRAASAWTPTSATPAMSDGAIAPSLEPRPNAARKSAPTGLRCSALAGSLASSDFVTGRARSLASRSAASTATAFSVTVLCWTTPAAVASPPGVTVSAGAPSAGPTMKVSVAPPPMSHLLPPTVVLSKRSDDGPLLASRCIGPVTPVLTASSGNAGDAVPKPTLEFAAMSSELVGGAGADPERQAAAAGEVADEEVRLVGADVPGLGCVAAAVGLLHPDRGRVGGADRQVEPWGIGPEADVAVAGDLQRVRRRTGEDAEWCRGAGDVAQEEGVGRGAVVGPQGPVDSTRGEVIEQHPGVVGLELHRVGRAEHLAVDTGEAGAQAALDVLIVRDDDIGARARGEHQQEGRGEPGLTPKVSHLRVVGTSVRCLEARRCPRACPPGAGSAATARWWRGRTSASCCTRPCAAAR